MHKYYTPTFELLIKAACASNISMLQAALSLNMNYNTFIKHAKRLNVYVTNQAGKGVTKNNSIKQTSLSEILSGIHPQYQSHKLKLRLLASNLKSHMCEQCNNTAWLNSPIALELHHIDGNSKNHKWDNIQLLCPNCHALTDNYRGKNIGKTAGMV